MEENNLISGDKKASEISKSASILIKKGEMNKFNSIKTLYKVLSKKDNWADGMILGGHAMFKTNDGYLAFTGPDPSVFTNRTEGRMQKNYNQKLMVEFPLDLTIDQYWGVVNNYPEIKGQKDGSEKVAPYKYSFWGYRCASSLLRVADENGIVDIKSKAGYFIHAIQPNALVRYLQRKNFDSKAYWWGGTKDPNKKYNLNFRYNKDELFPNGK